MWVVVQDLQSQLAVQQETIAAKDRDVSQLQEQIIELQAILAEPGKDPVQAPSSRLKDLEGKVAALEVHRVLCCQNVISLLRSLCTSAIAEQSCHACVLVCY